MKAQIMEPLQKFFELIEKRTRDTYQSLSQEVNWVISIATALSILITLLMTYSLLKALKSLSKVTEENEMLLLNILPQPIADRLKSGGKTHCR